MSVCTTAVFSSRSVDQADVKECYHITNVDLRAKCSAKCRSWRCNDYWSVLKVHWCLGMYSSGSTWAYNVTWQIAAAVDRSKPVRVHFVSRVEDLVGLGQSGRRHIVKSHEVDDEDAVVEISRRADAIIISIRDPRDAVTSLMLYQDRDFDVALSLVEKSARLCARFAGDQRALLLRYEAGFIDDVATLDRIAESFHQPLTATDRMQIFASTRRTAIEALIAKLPRQRIKLINRSRPGHLADPVTHWHTHHAGRTGEIGRWPRMLSEAQVSEVERLLADWMDRFSYQRHEVQPRA
jgi:hypothetical protein